MSNEEIYTPESIDSKENASILIWGALICLGILFLMPFDIIYSKLVK
jgi:hypothetical protein